MIRTISTFMALLALLLSTTACVSTSTFDKTVAAKNDEITTLKQQNAELKQFSEALVHLRDDLFKQKSDLEQDNASISQQYQATEQKRSAMQSKVGTLEEQQVAMQSRVGTLEEQQAAMLAANRQRQQQYDELVQRLSSEVEKGQLQVKRYQNMLSVDLAEKVFFDSGKAVLKPEGKKVLKKVGEALQGYENKLIRVVGHTDNVPIAKVLQKTFPTNWELSVSRATTVVRFLQDAGISPQRMVASGRSEYDPIAANDTDEGRQSNRRIEIMLIDQSLVNEMEKSSN